MEHTTFIALDTSRKQMAVAVASDEPRNLGYLGQFALKRLEHHVGG